LGRRGPHAYLEGSFPVVLKRGDGKIARKLSVVAGDKERTLGSWM